MEMLTINVWQFNAYLVNVKHYYDFYKNSKNHIFFSFLATPWHMEFLGQGSNPNQILNPLHQARNGTYVPGLQRHR